MKYPNAREFDTQEEYYEALDNYYAWCEFMAEEEEYLLSEEYKNVD